MTIETKSRSELKSYFVRNAIPTEANFAALIDAPLNQSDDGVFKLGSEPLSVVAAAGDRKPTLRLYDTYPKQAPSWTISLKPSQVPNDASTVRDGFGIVDGEGNTRLFIDRSTGALGLGVNAPQGAVDVLVPGAHSTWNRFIVAGATGWDGSTSHVTIGTGTGGIMLRNPHVPWLANESRASIRYGLSGGTGGGKYWDVGIRADSKFTFAFHGIDAHKLSLDANGNLSVTGKVSGSSVETGGTVSCAGLLFDTSVPGHLERDGSLYRTGGQVYLTVDDNLYIRKTNGDWTARFLTTNGSLTLTGGLDAGAPSLMRKIAVNDSTNSGATRGLWLWGINDHNHVIYSANPSGTSPAGNTAVRGYFDANHRMRFRTSAGGQGFLFENSSETALVDIDSDSGALWAKGALYTGDSALYFVNTEHDHTGIGNTQGYAAIENAKNHNALMILGRSTPGGRIVRVWDHFSVAGTKNFAIDHPLDPERRELVHSVVEGPEAAVFYRGEARLEDGRCTITLPAYFEKLTRREGRTVLITPKFAADEPSYAILAASAVVDGEFSVRAMAGDNLQQPFYWEVKAVRADVAPIEVEPLKPAGLRAVS